MMLSAKVIVCWHTFQAKTQFEEGYHLNFYICFNMVDTSNLIIDLFTAIL